MITLGIDLISLEQDPSEKLQLQLQFGRNPDRLLIE